jgi:thymidylate kinase
MNDLFEKLDLNLSNKIHVKQNLEVITINNPDGSTRWIIPVKAKKPNFLKFYSAHTPKAKLYAFIMKTIFRFKMQKMFLGKTIIHLNNDLLKKTNVDLTGTEWALFTGTKGPNNKIIYYNPQLETFTKIATTEQSQKLVDFEMKTLNQIEKLNLSSIETPKIISFTNKSITMSDISKNAIRSQKFTNLHLTALSELYDKTVVKLEKYRIPSLKTVHLTLDYLDRLKDQRISTNLLSKLRDMLNNLVDEKISVARAHGDFTPWNTMRKKNKLAVYDWELSKAKLPVGFDAFHFIMQDAILVKRKKWAEIKNEILSIDADVFKEWAQNPNAIMMDYLKLYLLINVSQYLKIYAHQREWHTQVSWLIESWNEAVTDLTATKETARQALITNFFDFIQNKRYAVIKANNESPAYLSVYSDIDITIEKKDLQGIINFFENHVFTKHILVSKKSFMSTIQVFLENGSVLSLDLIWQFKVKTLEFLSASDVLVSHFKNDYGVKVMSKAHTSVYLSCFYGLNNARVPNKYLHYANNLFVMAPANFSIYYSIFLSKERKHNELKRVINNLNPNRGIIGLKNRIYYFIDTVKSIISNKGMIISFSGVDGAGKSTIIKKTKQELEKKLRRNVVVLRHRPSMLPILSTWTKGHKKAQEDVINSLPRQGKNTSFLSSLLRFSYYFTDYLFGQFYVYFKHIIRSEVVIYDRYYFDFINDGKRSNIVLPKFITKFAYKFIMTPDLNFFLYADSETILKRKKELNAATITALNNEYIELFNDFSTKNKNSFYTIKNLILEDTLDAIMFQAMNKAA